MIPIATSGADAFTSSSSGQSRLGAQGSAPIGRSWCELPHNRVAIRARCGDAGEMLGEGRRPLARIGEHRCRTSTVSRLLVGDLHAFRRSPQRVKTGPDDPDTGLPKYPQKQTFSLLVGMSQKCRYCCKSRKSNDAENLAKVDF